MDKRPPEVIELSNAKGTLRTFLEGIYISRPELFEQFLDENYTIPKEEKDSVTTGPFTIRYTLNDDQSRKVYEETIDPEPVTVAPFIIKLLEKYPYIIPELLNEIRLDMLTRRLEFLQNISESTELTEKEVEEMYQLQVTLGLEIFIPIEQ